jgi:hypothetical protein
MDSLEFEEFTLEEFFETFVLYSGAEIPDEVDPETLHQLTSNYLTFSRLGPRDVSIKYDAENLGYVLISTRGLRLIQNFREMKSISNAVQIIQILFRRARARARINFLVDAILQHRLSESDSSDVPTNGASRTERKSLRKHLRNLSRCYQNIIPKSGGSSSGELEFLALLNNDETFKLPGLNSTRAPNLEESSSGRTFQQYSPKAFAWIGAVLNLNLPEDCFLPHILADGVILCRLAVQMYPKISCHLLQKGPEFSGMVSAYFNPF